MQWSCKYHSPIWRRNNNLLSFDLVQDMWKMYGCFSPLSEHGSQKRTLSAVEVVSAWKVIFIPTQYFHTKAEQKMHALQTQLSLLVDVKMFSRQGRLP